MPPKPDVRRLLKKQQTERNKETKVTHPFAKYDEINRLICIVCNAPVKNPTVWQAHLGSSAHRDNIQKLKALKQQQQQQQQQQQNLKRKAPSPSPPPQDTKRSRMEEIELDEQPDSSEEEEQDEEMGLPTDFFDDSGEPIEEDDDEDEEEPAAEEKQNGSIPTGFFDDPEQEARMQGNLAPEEQAQVNLEKDLEDFNEAMIDVTKESKEEQEQDDETFWLERHQDISEEQAMLDQRVEKLKIMRQQKQVPQMGKDEEEDTLGLKSSVRLLLKTKVVQQTESMFEDESESEEEEEEDWRAQQL